MQLHHDPLTARRNSFRRRFLFFSSSETWSAMYMPASAWNERAASERRWPSEIGSPWFTERVTLRSEGTSRSGARPRIDTTSSGEMPTFESAQLERLDAEL